MSQRKFLSLLVVVFAFLHGPMSSFAQVTPQTGSAVFSMPIFNWQDNQSRLTSVIALSYNSGSGLKVNDIASNEGQGWSMVAGGVITRMQIGQPDDQQPFAGSNPNAGDQDLTKYPGGYLYPDANAPLSQGCPTWLTKYPTYGGQNVLYAQHNDVAQDRELDRFLFQFNGKSGEFVIDTTGGWHGVPIGDSKMKISLQTDLTLVNQGIRTTITSFTITDVDGLIYKFSLHGLTKLLTSNASSGDGSKVAAQPNISNGGRYCQSAFDDGPTGSPWSNQYMSNPYIISSWYLEEIDDPFTSRKISFTYNPPLNLSNLAGSDISYNQGTDNFIMISYKKSVTTALELSTIIYPDGHTATFNYSTAPRWDYSGEFALSSVSITYTYAGTTRYLSQYLLNTTYFIQNRYGTPSTAFEKSVARLCLRSIKKLGPDLKEDAPPYQFDYYLNTGSGSADDVVPPPFYYCKDVWGYYNGTNSIGYANTPVTQNAVNPYALNFDMLEGLCFQHTGVAGTYYNAKPGYAANGLLKEVIYPTGGSLTYTYAQNTGSFINNTSTVLTVGGVHVSRTSSSDGGYSNGCGTPIVTQYAYVVNGAGSASSLWGLEAPNNSMQSNNSWKEEKSTFHFSLSSGFTCKWHYIYPGILNQYQTTSLDEFQHIMNAIGPVLGILGILSTIDDVLAVCSTVGFWTVVPLVLDVISYVIGLALTCGQQTKNTTNTIFYNYDLNLVSPLPVQFKRVEITESPGTIGKTVEQFTHGDPNDLPVDYPLWFPAGSNTALSVKQRFAPWAYGLPKLTTVYDVNGNIIKETQNVYDFSNAQLELVNYGPCYGASGPKTSYRCQVLNTYSYRSDAWAASTQYDAVPAFLPATSLTAPGNNGDMIADLYDTYTGHVNLVTTYDRTYRTTDVTQYVQAETDYVYNQGWYGCLKNFTQPYSSNYDLSEVITKQSNGDVNTKYYFYSFSYNGGLAGNGEGILQNLVNANIVSMPVVTQTTVTKAGSGSTYYLGEKVTEFTQLANNDLKPSRVLEQRFATPVQQGSFSGYGGPAGGFTNYANYKIPEVFTYDQNYNLVGVQDEGNRIVTNIYDYNDKYIVASVINANPLVDKPAYTSFENADLSRSGWTISGIISFNNSQPSVTGNNNFALLSQAANSLSASGLNTATAYILSFWANNGNVTVTGGATLTKSGPTYNGFTYYEYSIAAGTSSVVLKDNTATNANIDELRLYPAGARMRTTTYDPLIGKTSECDENNRITYYTYDNLGRLQFVEDETHNITKMYEYNNVSQAKQTGCPAAYTNPAISELVTRNNCTAGYQGSTLTYSVAAGLYSSTFSQWDADIQAEIYLLTNAQNYANTNGTCSLIYYNVAESQTDTTTDCAAGYAGGLVTYTVPANTYSSIISQADANQQALNDIAANAQYYANLTGSQNCSISTTPDWEWNVGDPTDPQGPSYCASVNGALPPHLFVLLTDVNPNSPTYGQTMWEDSGPNSACPAGNYYNVSESQTFTKACSSGYTGSSVTYTVPPGEYSSTTSQAAANQLATNDINANGQNYANAHGTCTLNENITYNDERAFQYSVRFTNNSTGAIYNFTPNANSSGTLGQVPSGVYTVYICPINNYTNNNNYNVLGAVQTSVVCATFNNVSVTGTGNIIFY